MQELRWGVLSTADIGRSKVIPAIQRAQRCRVTAIASRDARRAREVASELGIERTYDTYQALLDDPDIDAVYIPLPNHLHMAWTIAAAEARKHVLCEKPLALTSADAERMIVACQAAGVTLIEAFMYRLHPSWQAVREIVDSGELGDLMAVQSWFSYYNDDPANIRNIFEAGGGALYDIGCYCINLARLLFGSEPARVTGAVRRDPEHGIDIVSSAVLEFPGGGQSTFTCSTRTATDQRVHIYGTRGRLSLGIPFNIPPDRPTEIYVATPDATGRLHTRTVTFPVADPYTVEAEAFAATILDGTPPPFPTSDAVANLRVIEQLFALDS
jgi:predicted dehydrogenase